MQKHKNRLICQDDRVLEKLFLLTLKCSVHLESKLKHKVSTHTATYFSSQVVISRILVPRER